jgi:CAAX protease family protein
MWGLQILISFPIWLLILSPFQEFFFRGWLQPRFEVSLGKWWGLVVTSIAFALWHFFPQFEGTMTSTLPVSSLVGIVSVIGIGLLFGYVFQRTGNIVAPWLAHAVGGIGLVLIGRMVFLQYIP